MPETPLRGRGSSTNPPNRYEALHVEPDDSSGSDRTIFYRDTSRSVLAENVSPDVPFRYSLNPYRGCEHGCAYCLDPDTPVLHADMRWRRIGDVQVGDVLAGFDEYPERGRTRKLRMSVVEHVMRSRRPTMRLFTDRAEVTTTAEHRWLDAAGRWVPSARLAPGRRLRRLPVVVEVGEAADDDYRVGYITGLSLGDGTFRFQPGWRSDKCGYPAAYWRVALIDAEPLARLVQYLARFEISAYIRPFWGGPTSRKAMQKVEIRSLPKLAVVHRLLAAEPDSHSYRRGFMAGFFDAEGYSGDSLRISQKDVAVLERVRAYGQDAGVQCPARGSGALDAAAPGRPARRLGGRRHDQRRDRAPDTEKNALKPWRERQWVIPPAQNAAFVCAMEDVLDVYQQPYDATRPVVCLDEASRQLVHETRPRRPVAPGHPARVDYEYARNGTVNLFMLFEPLAGRRHVAVTARRTACDYARVVQELVDVHYPTATTIVLVQERKP